MDDTGCGGRCAFERAAEVEFRALADSVREMKERLTRLESALARGTALLVANLAAVPMQESGIPLLAGAVPILVVLAMELLLSVLTDCFKWFSHRW